MVIKELRNYLGIVNCVGALITLRNSKVFFELKRPEKLQYHFTSFCAEPSATSYRRRVCSLKFWSYFP